MVRPLSSSATVWSGIVVLGSVVVVTAGSGRPPVDGHVGALARVASAEPSRHREHDGLALRLLLLRSEAGLALQRLAERLAAGTLEDEDRAVPCGGR